MHFEIVGKIKDVEMIALVRISGDKTRKAEVHWYEAHGLGRKKMKIKRFLN